MDLIVLLGIVFVAGFLVLISFRRIDFPSIPSLIFSGVAVSYFIDLSNILDILILGISFLVFYIGLRTDLDGFRKVGSESLNVSLIQIAIAFTLVFSVSTYLGFDRLTSLYIALAGSLASTLAGTDIFNQNLRMDLHHGQISNASNFVQDIVAVIIISGLSVGLTVSGLNSALMTGLILFLAFIFREIFSKRFHKLVKTQELRTVSMVAVFAASIGLAEYIDISIIAAVFAGGLAFSRGSETEEFLDDLEPLKDFFSVIFFVGLGALVTTPSYTTLVIAAVIICSVLILRPLLISVVMLIDGQSARKSFKTSSNMLQVSEFALAAVIIAWSTGLVDGHLKDAVIISAAVTMAVSTFSIRHSDFIYRKFSYPFLRAERVLEYSPKNIDLDNHVVLVGFGVRGQKVAEELKQKGKEFLVIDYNTEHMERARLEDVDYLFRDFMEKGVLEDANISQADCIVVTSDHKEIIEKAVSVDNIPKLVLVDSEEEAERLQSQNVKTLLESEVVEDGLKNRVFDLIDN